MDARLSRHALAKPGTFMTEQWVGAHVFKVGAQDAFRMFAILRPGDDRLTVKLDPDTADFLIEAGAGRRNAHLPRGGWIELDLAVIEPDDATERIDASYDLCKAALPKRVQACLGAKSSPN